jgi:hypothetical protein
MASGGFSLGFSNGFDFYSGVLPSGVLDPSLLSYYWLNDFNKCQEINIVWNK